MGMNRCRGLQEIVWRPRQPADPGSPEASVEDSLLSCSDRYLRKQFLMKNFYGVVSGKPHRYALQSQNGKVRIVFSS